MKRLLPLLPLIFIILKILVLPGCANIIPPQGGPRDSIPPQLIKASPGDSTRNFTGNRIVFTFDEYIDVQNIQEQLIVSPSPVTNPIVNFRLNTMTVKIADTLEPNTTYTMRFGDAIKDYTEGNPLKGFTYTFSTGRYIDSLELSGNVVLAETGKIDTTLIVMLHISPDDSVLLRERPRYITRLDSKGNFIFRNLPPRTFYLYALQDEGGTRRYIDNKKLFAFADKPVIVDGKTTPVTLYAYASKPSFQQFILPVSIGNRKKNTDAVADTRLKYQTNLNNNQQDLLGNFVMSFEQPLRRFDSAKIRLYTDSVFTPAGNYKFELDSTRSKLSLSTSWKEARNYHLIMDKDFAEDSAGRKLLKTDTLSFLTKKLSDYGSLKLKFRNLDMAKNPVLLFVLGNAVVKSVPLSSPEFSEAVFLPGDYELRILYDENKNGVWDPGEFYNKHKQPEIVKAVDRRIIVKPGIANDYEIAL